MPTYQHDMMHYSQDKCKKKDQCYRYWLGQHLKESGYEFASFYWPQEPVEDGCEYYLKIKDYD